MSKPNFEESPDVLEWIKLQEEIEGVPDVLNAETGTQKLIRKATENPFVPIGATATVCCLSYGLLNFFRGDQRMSQLMMRSRVVAQGFTVLALVGGVVLAATKTSTKND